MSNSGTISLITSRLFQHYSDEDIEQWIMSIHEVTGIAFTGKKSKCVTSAGYDVAIEKWKLMFPQLTHLSPLLIFSTAELLMNILISGYQLQRFSVF